MGCFRKRKIDLYCKPVKILTIFLVMVCTQACSSDKNADKSVSLFLNKVFIEQDVDYFINNLYSGYRKKPAERHHQKEEFIRFFRRNGEIAQLKYTKVTGSLFRFDEKLEQSVVYLVKAKTNEQKSILFTITFIDEKDGWKFYGYSEE